MLELNESNVREIFDECTSIKGNEKKKDLIEVPFVNCEGLSYVLLWQKVGENRGKIAELLTQLPDLTYEEVLHSSLKKNKYGEQWTNHPDDLDVEKLTTLGIAAGFLQYKKRSGLMHNITSVEYSDAVTAEDLEQIADNGPAV